MKTWKLKDAYVCEIRIYKGIEWEGTPSGLKPYKVKTELIGFAVVKKSKFFDSNKKVKRIYTGEVIKTRGRSNLVVDLEEGEVFYTPPIPMSACLKEDADLDKVFTIKEANLWEQALFVPYEKSKSNANDEGEEK